MGTDLFIACRFENDAGGRDAFGRVLRLVLLLSICGPAHADLYAVDATAKPTAMARPAASRTQNSEAIPTLAGTGDAFFAALPVGRWVGMAASSTIRKAVAEFAPDYREYGNTGIASITRAWSGAGFDPETGTFYITGGGHFDSNFNGIISANAETGVFGVPIQPTVLTPGQVAAIKASWPPNNPWISWGQAMYPSPYYYDGKPGAIHTYGSIWYARGKVIMPGRIYDLATRKFSHYETHAGSPGGMGLEVGRRLIGVNQIVDDYWSLLHFDLDTQTESVSHFGVPYEPGIGLAYSFNGQTFGCAIGNVLYFISTQTAQPAFGIPVAWSMDVTKVAPNYTATRLKPTNAWSAEDMAGLQMNTMALDTDKNILYIPSKDLRYFLTWKPLTGELGKVVVSGAVPVAQGNSAYGRLRYYPKRKCLVLVNSIDEPIYFLRLS